MSDASLPSRFAPSRGGDAKDSLVLLDSSKLGNLRVDFERLEDDFHAGVVGVFGNVDFVGTGEMLHAGGDVYSLAEIVEAFVQRDGNRGALVDAGGRPKGW